MKGINNIRSKLELRILIVFVWLILTVTANTSYLPWSPPDTDVEGLVCPSHCFTSNTTEQKCCFCESKSEWETIGFEPPVPLHVEYLDVSGYSVNLLTEEKNSKSSGNLTEVEHINGRMKALPANLCEFHNLVKMIFSNNEIEAIKNISCLTRIEVIDLRHNRIQTINNETFRALDRLRLLNVSYNPLKKIDPYSFQLLNGNSIFFVDVRMGSLKTVDVSNFIFEKQYCEINFNGNPVEQIINPTKFQIDKEKEYGLDGTVSLQYCKLYQMMNLSSIGLVKPNEFYKYLKFSFDAIGSNISCDCFLAPILSSELQNARKFWVPLDTRYNNLTCMFPKKLRGVKLKYLVDSGDLDDMTCDEPAHCPRQCDCYSQPSQNHMVINCTDAGLLALPETLPWGNRYTLLMEGNNIKSLDQRDYLRRVHKADFGNTPLQTLTDNAVSMLPNDAKIFINGDGLSNLPSSIFSKLPNNIVLGNTYIECTCENKWIQIWINKRFITTNSTNIFCKNFDRVRIEQLDTEQLNCDPIDTLWQKLAAAVSALITLVIGLALLFICYKPEIFLIYRHRILCRKHDFHHLYDVYLCFDERNILIRRWIIQTLSPYLDGSGYRLFLPCRDESLGGSREKLRGFAINNSRAYVVVVSEGAFNSHHAEDDSIYCSPFELSMQMEFSNILCNFKCDSTKRIAVINFDNLKTHQTDIRYIKAFFRTRESVDFTNRHDDILKTIRKKIGPPGSASITMATNIMPDARPDFNPKKIYRSMEQYTLTDNDSFVLPNQYPDCNMKTKYCMNFNAGGIGDKSMNFMSIVRNDFNSKQVYSTNENVSKP